MLVSGAVASTVHAAVAGVASTLPAASVARTEKLWLPSASVPVMYGDEQLDHEPPSSLHSSVAPLSVAENPSVAMVALTVPDGAVSNAVFGATVSTVKPREAGEGS